MSELIGKYFGCNSGISNIFKRQFLPCVVVSSLGLGFLVVISVPPLLHSWQSFVLESGKSNTSIGG